MTRAGGGDAPGAAGPAHRRTCLVTGAAGGLGSAIADAFLAAGWSVIGWDLVPIGDPRVAGQRIDLTDHAAVASAAGGLPPLAAVVSCAGVPDRTPALDLDAAELERVLRVNVVAGFGLSRAVLPAVRQAGGTIVHIASVGGHVGFRHRLAYDTSKVALLAMVRHLAIEWGPLGVRVVSVSPGFVRTGMAVAGISAGLTRMERIEDHTPIGRLVEPEEVAEVVLRVVQPGFSAVTGSDILVDGGFAALSGF